MSGGSDVSEGQGRSSSLFNLALFRRKKGSGEEGVFKSNDGEIHRGVNRTMSLNRESVSSTNSNDGQFRRSSAKGGRKFDRQSTTTSAYVRQSETECRIRQDNHDQILIDDRESHTSDLQKFDRFVLTLIDVDRNPNDTPYEDSLWNYIRETLETHGGSADYIPLKKKSEFSHMTADDAAKFMAKFEGLDLINPINPHKLADATNLPLSVVLTELVYSTSIGLTTLKFAPQCQRCGGSTMHTSSMERFDEPKEEIIACNMCNYPNHVTSFDTIAAVFFLHPSVLYVLAKNFGCYPSRETLRITYLCAPVPANAMGSGVRYSIGCNDQHSVLEKPLPKGRYRGHCPISSTSFLLDVQDNAPKDDSMICRVPLKVSDLLISKPMQHTSSTVTDVDNPVISVPHGRIHFDISPDTNTLFCLWLQKHVSDDTVYRLPKEERSAITTAADILHHPSFNRYFEADGVRNVLALSAGLQIGLVVLVFTDVVGSTDMYAKLGDWRALELIQLHFKVVFAAFSRWGRVVKTIGDAVMAAFASPAAAIEAAAESLLEIERQCQQNEGVEFRIRIGIHGGSTVVIPVNSVTDYFGQTVNITARIEGRAEPSGCLISQDVLDSDPSAVEVFEAIIASVDFEEIPQQVLNLKGIVGETKARGFKLAVKKKPVEPDPQSEETPPMIKANSFWTGNF